MTPQTTVVVSRRWLPVWAAAACLIVPSPAGAAGRASASTRGDTGDKELCIAAAEEGQQLRDETKYQLARGAFSRCARDVCPQLIRQDCRQWLQDVDEKAPTVVFGARDDRGTDLTDVTVMLDGSIVATALDGKPFPVDPGEHALHFEAPGYLPVGTRVVVRAGEKNRGVAVQFKPRTPRSADVPAPPAGRPVPIAVWALGGVAVAAFTTEAIFGVSGISERARDLSSGGCANRCASSEKSAIQAKFIIADVSLGVGVVAAAAAVYLYFSSRPPPAVDIAPTPGGAMATFTRRF